MNFINILFQILCGWVNANDKKETIDVKSKKAPKNGIGVHTIKNALTSLYKTSKETISKWTGGNKKEKNNSQNSNSDKKQVLVLTRVTR